MTLGELKRQIAKLEADVDTLWLVPLEDVTVYIKTENNIEELSNIEVDEEGDLILKYHF